MDKIFKIMIALILVMLVFLFLPEMSSKFAFEDEVEDTELFLQDARGKENAIKSIKELDHWVNDSVYVWDQQRVNWVASGVYQKNESYSNNLSNKTLSREPIKLKWEVLMDIHYRLRYFKQIKADVFSPFFGEKVKALNGKEVIIEGFVIPFDESGELLALSYNPYSSCFFCGNASPASVISMFMDDPGEFYDLDDFKKFKGTLFLNYGDPNQFYYILKNAVAL